MGDGGEGDRIGHHTGAFDRWSEKQWKMAQRKKVEENTSCLASMVYGGIIAGSICGSVEARALDTMREYRDNVLLNNDSGRVGVELYYGKAGKMVSEFVQRRARFLIPVIRKGFDHLIREYEEGRL